MRCLAVDFGALTSPVCCLPPQIVRRLLLFGFPSDARSLAPVAAVNTCGPAMLRALHELQALRPAKAPKSQLLAMLDRGILKLMKTLSQVQETHPWCDTGLAACPILQLLLPRDGFISLSCCAGCG